MCYYTKIFMNNCNFKFIQSIYKMLFKGDNINDKISNVVKYNIKMNRNEIRGNERNY